MQTVLIIKCRAESFRVPFYEALGDTLAARNITLTVAYGQPSGVTPDEPNPDSFRYGLRLRNKYIHLGPLTAVWQPVFSLVKRADLVIVQQGNANLINHVLLALRQTGLVRVAFWGHGKNFQASNPHSLQERFKRTCSRWVDHWFAYTEDTRSALLAARVPEQIITVVNNAIDSHAMRTQYESITDCELTHLKERLSLAESMPVGIYCGRMYDIKNIPFLLRAVQLIKQELPDFHFLAIGEGNDAAQVRTFATRHAQWFHYFGRTVGREKAAYFRLAGAQLSPGAVGLSVVDSFAMLTPLVTTASGLHGPEICYLRDGSNGRIVEGDENAYASEVVKMFSSPSTILPLLPSLR